MSNTEVKVLNAESSWWETACEGRTLPCNGGLAQLGEHLPYKQEVTGSSPVSSIGDYQMVVFFNIYYCITVKVPRGFESRNSKMPCNRFFKGGLLL